MPTPVHGAVTRHLTLEQEIGGYEAAARARDQLEGFYTTFASLLNAAPDELAYVENATRAWDMAVYGIPWQPGDRILTHESEYASNYLAFLQLKQRQGIEIDLAPSDESGQVDVVALEQRIQPRTRMIALTHVPSQGGLINPAAAVGRVARDHGLIYVLDACQSAGQMPLDVQALGCHVLTGTGRKFLRGPRGTGFLYVSRHMRDTLTPPFVDLISADWTGSDTFAFRDDARRYETFERFVAGQIGLAEAARYAMNLGLDAIQARVHSLADDLRTRLAAIPGITVHDQGVNRCGIATFTRDGNEPRSMAERLREQRINVSVTTMANARLDLARRHIPALVRASVHYYNTQEEIERFCQAVEAL